jgi:FkbM family methyltransferase
VKVLVGDVSTATGAFQRMKALCLRAAQATTILVVRPYIFHELPGWGKIYSLFVGDFRRNWFWANGPVKVIRGKLNGYVMHLDLSQWADRVAYFLGRWVELEIQLFMASQLREGDTVIDVGANRGMFALYASRLVGPKGKVVCFEPNPNCWRVLDHEIATNRISNIVVHRCGLADQAGELTLSVPLINSGEGTFGPLAHESDAAYTVQAEIRRGDDLLRDETPVLIKIDVEGFEPKVVAGLAQTLERCHPLVMTEVISRHLARCGSTASELLALMEQLDYRGFRLGLKKRNGKYEWRLGEFDPGTSGFDVVWVHASALARFAPFLSGLENQASAHLPSRAA